MTKQGSASLSRRGFIGTSLGVAATAGLGLACGDEEAAGPAEGAAGRAGVSGGTSPDRSGAAASGDVDASGSGSSSGARSGQSGRSGRDQTSGATGTKPPQGKSGQTTGDASRSGEASDVGASGRQTDEAGRTDGSADVADADSGQSPRNDASVRTSLVGLVRHADVGQATRDAIAFVGGLPNVSGKTVLIKPNVNTGDPSPFSPNPKMGRALIEMLKAAGAAKIVLADRSYTPVDTMAAMRKSGLYDVAQELDVDVINLEGTPASRVQPAGANNWDNGFRIYDLVLKGADVVINLCCCKNHNSSANFTAALKNWVGILHTGDRNTAHGNIGGRIPELHLARREDLILMDATNVVLTKGPNPGGLTASPNIVVASKDPVANDATAIAILKRYLTVEGIKNPNIDRYTCWNQPQMVRALALGLGIRAKSEYTQQSSGIAEIDSIMKYLEA